jgi:predicted nucleic acid-binding protein
MERKMKKRVYIDSSVIYGAPSKEFSEDSKRFWESIRNDKVIIIVSDVLDAEMKRAPVHVRNLYKALLESQIERVESTGESNALAEQYIAEKIVGESSTEDCQHIALATIVRADAVVSWNFKHMIYRRAGYNDINEKLGYPGIEIQSPRKFMEASHDEN